MLATVTTDISSYEAIHVRMPSYTPFTEQPGVKSSLTYSPCDDKEVTLITAYTEYSICRVQHTMSTAYTVYCIIPRSTVSHSQPVPYLLADHGVFNSLHSHNYKLTNQSSFSSHHVSLLHYPLQIELLQVLCSSRLIMASRCISKLAWSQLPSVSLHSRGYSLQGRSITASECVSKVAWSQPQSEFLNSPDYGLQVHTILSSQFVSKLIWSWPPSAFTKLVRPQPPSISLNSHHYVVRVCTITASKCIDKLSRSQPPSVCPNSYDYSLQTPSITASEYISKFTHLSHGDMVDLQGRQPIIHTAPHLTRYLKGEFEGNSGSTSRRIGRGWEDMKGYPAMMNHTNCMDLWTLGNSAWWSTQIAWIYERSARVHRTKSWER